MRPINTLSILMYWYPIYKYHSYRCAIILINGLLYHGLLSQNKKMFALELICNFSIFAYTGYHNPTLLPKAFCSIFLWILNDTLEYYNHINTTTGEILHVITVHIPMMYCLIKALERSRGAIQNIPTMYLKT